MKVKSRRRAKKPRRRDTQALKVKLVRIGNSRGIRLPKVVIEQAALEGEIDMIVRQGEVVLRSAKHPRAGWDEQMRKALLEHGDDIEDWSDWHNMPNEFDEKEWTW